MAPLMKTKLMITRRRWPLAAALTAVTLVAAACGSASGSGKAGGTGTTAGTSVTAWIVTTGPSPVNTKINQAVADFEAKHPGDHITVDYIENQS
jgi:ABC-type glycerol-3-phosphate transport system substrate-binding protein